MDAYRSEKSVPTTSKVESKKRIEAFVAQNNTCRCRALKGRSVRLTKYLEASVPRKDATRRLRTFFVAIDIIKHTHHFSVRLKNKLREFELVGQDRSGVEVRVHIREEMDRNDRTLYLISSFGDL